MVLGFPGTTDHYITSYGLKETMDVTNKLRYEIRTVKINVLREEMASAQDIRIKYASKYASCSNYWKYSNEQNKALKNLNTMQVKKDIESEFTKWAKSHDAKYGRALGLLEKSYAAREEYEEAMMYFTEGLLSGPELPWNSCKLGSRILNALNTENEEARNQQLEEIRANAAEKYKRSYKVYCKRFNQRKYAFLYRQGYQYQETL